VDQKAARLNFAPWKVEFSFPAVHSAFECWLSVCSRIELMRAEGRWGCEGVYYDLMSRRLTGSEAAEWHGESQRSDRGRVNLLGSVQCIATGIHAIQRKK